MKNLLGIDIGGTKCAVTYGRCEGSTVEIVDKFRFNTTDVEQTLNNLLKTTELVMTHNSLTAENTAAIGISCGGPLDSKQGIILSPPNLPGWDHIEIHFGVYRATYGTPRDWVKNVNQYNQYNSHHTLSLGEHCWQTYKKIKEEING